ncbi:MAG: hypothetical protein QM736_24805 [Vicinamibacterales bacterium]
MGELFRGSGGGAVVDGGLHLDVFGYGSDGHVGELDALGCAGLYEVAVEEFILREGEGAAGVIDEFDEIGDQRLGGGVLDEDDGAAVDGVDFHVRERGL